MEKFRPQIDFFDCELYKKLLQYYSFNDLAIFPGEFNMYYIVAREIYLFFIVACEIKRLLYV